MAKSVGMFQRPVEYSTKLEGYSVLEDVITSQDAYEYMKIEILNIENESSPLLPDESMLSITLFHRINQTTFYYIYFYIYPKKKIDEFGFRTIFNEKYSIFMINVMKNYVFLGGRNPLDYPVYTIREKMLKLLDYSIAAINENIELINSSAKWERYF
jgi:hypothetical protein